MSGRVSAFGGFAIAVGIVVLVGWILHIETFKSLHPSLPAMAANAAIGFILTGVALVACGSERRWLARLFVPCALAVFAIGALTSLEYGFGLSLPLDELLVRDAGTLAIPGRMAVATAVCFVLVGGALLTLDRRVPWLGAPAQALALLCIAISLVALIGHLFGVEALYRISRFTAVAVHTSITFVVVSLGILYARPDRGVMRSLTMPDSPAAANLRRLLPIVIVLPICLGWLRWLGERAGFYDGRFGLALFASSNVIVLSSFVWSSGAAQLRRELAQRAGDVLERERERLRVTDRDFVIETIDLIRAAVVDTAAIEVATRRLGTYLELARCQVGELDASRSSIVLARGYTSAGEPRLGAIPLTSFTAKTIEELRAGRVVVHANTATDRSTRDLFDADFATASHVVVPLLVDGEWRAMVAAVSSTHRVWSDRELEIVQMIGDRAWAQVIQVRLIREREFLVEELRTLTSELESRVAERTRQLTASLRERDVLLQEVHHRVKNNLQVIASMISMQMRTLEPHERGVLRECQNRVQTIALVHEKLYKSNDYASIPFAEYAEGLAASVFQAGGASPNVTLSTEIAAVDLPVDKAIPCGLIINELIVNALKHAFPADRAGTIRVELARAEGNRVRLVVADDGQGMEPSASKRSDSLGLRLVATLAQQLDGVLVTTEQPSMRVEVTFPLEAN